MKYCHIYLHFGLIMKSQVYVNNYLWPTYIFIGASAILLLIAFALNQSRDLGEGLIPAKPGKRHASQFLQSPLGLSVRLLKNVFIAWAIGLLLLGASYGSVMGDMESFLKSNELFAQMGITDAERIRNNVIVYYGNCICSSYSNYDIKS